jgi:hypothetical protein
VKLPIATAQKLLGMIETGTGIPASSMPGTLVMKMVEDAVLYRKQTGRTKALLFVQDVSALQRYLFNHFNIADLARYVQSAGAEETTRSEAIAISGDSKWKPVRTFTGFMLNCYIPIPATLHHEPFFVHPVPGTFTFMYDYTGFEPASTVTIVGIENAENFRRVDEQKYLFTDLLPLFVSRYPQSNDLVKWLQSMANGYLHFGDLDFAGINIFMHEYRRHLGQKASFFIPPGVADLLEKFGSRELYNKQLHLAREWENEPELNQLMQLFHKHKKVLEQEIFIKL